MSDYGYFIGLMSGTSADALDGVMMQINHQECRYIDSVSLPIHPNVRARIHELISNGFDEINGIAFIERAITRLSCLAVNQLCEQTGISPSQVKAIGCHGQTVRHVPPSSEPGFTMQLSNPSAIAETCGITTIADFRRRDIVLGGHGAPLVPAFHHAVFSTERPRAIINIGGVSNVTWLVTSKVTGFDTGPGNNLIDAWCQRHYSQAYDKDGLIAARGKVCDRLLNQLLSHTYFQEPPPKSTGRETFNLSYVDHAIEACETQASSEDIAATLTALTAEHLSYTMRSIDPADSADIFICGGGALNPVIMSHLSRLFSKQSVSTTQTIGLHPLAVEGAAFAWLAYRTLNGLTGNLPQVTGARKACVLGGIYPA